MTSRDSRVVWITGANRGIGAGIAQQLLREGWNVVGTASTSHSRWEVTPSLGLVCDVADVLQVRATIKVIVDTYGIIDAVINNAGTTGNHSFDTRSPGSDEEDSLWRRIIDVNLNGTYYVSKYVLPHLPDNRGRIINMGSVLSHRGVHDGGAYVASKHAVLGLTRSLALHCAPRRITVNAICPGWTRSDMAFDQMTRAGLSEESLGGEGSGVPLGRFIEPVEIGQTVSFLLSEAAKNITGQSIVVDGGMLACQ